MYMMNALREQLVDRMIQIYGFESPIVMDFCCLCEQACVDDQYLETIVESHEDCPAFEIEDDE